VELILFLLGKDLLKIREDGLLHASRLTSKPSNPTRSLSFDRLAFSERIA